MSDFNEREAFEKWYLKTRRLNGDALERIENVHSEARYASRETEWAFRAWQAARAQGGEPSCLTCGDIGWIGGPTYSDPGESGVECPDCNSLDRQFDTHSQSAVPDGWQLVPVDPTESMVDAGASCNGSTPSAYREAIRTYREMLNAAPKPQD